MILDEPLEGLSVAYYPDGEHEGRLHVRARFEGFEGTGEAWIDRQRLSEFAEALKQYPLDETTPPPSLSSGYGSVDDIELELIGLVAAPVGGKGQVVMTVRLAAETWIDGQPHAVHRVVIEFPTSYEFLRRFSGHLHLVLGGNLDQATLDFDRLI